MESSRPSFFSSDPQEGNELDYVESGQEPFISNPQMNDPSFEGNELGYVESGQEHCHGGFTPIIPKAQGEQPDPYGASYTTIKFHEPIPWKNDSAYPLTEVCLEMLTAMTAFLEENAQYSNYVKGNFDTIRTICHQNNYNGYIEANGETLFMWLVRHNCIAAEIKNTLIKEAVTNKLVNLHAKDEDGNTLLHCLASKKDLGKSIELLINRKVPVDEKNKEGATPLCYAVFNDIESATTTLMNAGADVFIPLLTASTDITSADKALKRLFNHLLNVMKGTDDKKRFSDKINALDPVTGNSVLHYAVESGSRSVVDKFLKLKLVNVNIRNGRNGRTPLHEAVADVDAEMVKLLLSKGANITTESYSYTDTHGEKIESYSPLDLLSKNDESKDAVVIRNLLKDTFPKLKAKVEEPAGPSSSHRHHRHHHRHGGGN